MSFAPFVFPTFLQQAIERLSYVRIVWNPDVVEGACSQELSDLRDRSTLFFHCRYGLYFAGDGLRPYGPHRWQTTGISGGSKAVFSLEKVTRASSSLCSILSHSEMWSTTNLQHPFDSDRLDLGILRTSLDWNVVQEWHGDIRDAVP